MVAVQVLEVLAWVIFLGGIVVMFVRGALGMRSIEQRTRTGRILAWSMLVSGTILAVVYGLATFDLADTIIDSGRRGGEPWFPAALGVAFTAMAPGILRRTAPRPRD